MIIRLHNLHLLTLTTCSGSRVGESRTRSSLLWWCGAEVEVFESLCSDPFLHFAFALLPLRPSFTPPAVLAVVVVDVIIIVVVVGLNQVFPSVIAENVDEFLGSRCLSSCCNGSVGCRFVDVRKRRCLSKHLQSSCNALVSSPLALAAAVLLGLLRGGGK